MGTDVNITCRFFATFRKAVGGKTQEYSFTSEMTVFDLLSFLEEEYPGLEGELLDNRELRGNINVLQNGRNVTHRDGTDTRLSDGDTISIFPPVAGGAQTEITQTFRGVPEWKIIDYLESVGGKQTDKTTVNAERWQASTKSTTVSIGPSMTLTEVTVKLQGEKEALEEILPKLKQKAMRAGG